MNTPLPRLLITLIVLLSTTLTALAQSQNSKPKLNQIGFYPDGPKLIITPETEATSFVIKRASDGTEVYSGNLISGGMHSPSNETVKIADFTDLDLAGLYTLEIVGGEASYQFGISDNIFEDVTDGIIKALYFNRASMELEEEFAGQWARPAGHPDEVVRVHSSAATAERPEGTIISSPGGWYDAGDYNKYIVPIAMSINQMLFAYENFPEYFAEQNLNIPESSNEIPDILDEALFALRWVITMQDLDGGVYHKLTTANFSGAVMPHQATAHRFVVQKTSAATFDFAAVMAQAARVYQPFVPDFADSALEAAKAAWQWGLQNPAIFYDQSATSNPAINTGAYGDGNTSDEQFWAASELFITTGEDSLYDKSGWSTNVGNPGWNDVRALGLYSLVHHRKNLASSVLQDTSAMKQKLTDSFSWYVNDAQNSPYRSVAGQYDWQYYWGSNGGAGNLGMAMVLLYKMNGQETYYNAAVHVADYILGRNPVGYSYITGFGDQPPMFIHHRQSQADGIEEPVPGWVAGGPNPNNQDQDCGSQNYNSTLPALSYLDDWCSYSTNEITTYWNSPFIFLFSGLEHLTPKTGQVLNIDGTGSLPTKIELNQNYPNPFNPSTVIDYTLAETGETGLSIFNSMGQKVAQLVDEVKPTGTYSVTWDASNVASGIYYYRLQSNEQVVTKKMTLIK